MKLYCPSCGMATHYNYSSGKPTNCGTCKGAFDLDISLTPSQPFSKTSGAGSNRFSWVGKVNLNEIFSIAVDDSPLPPAPKEE